MWLTLLLLALAVLLAAALLILPPSAGKVSPVLTDDGRPAENGIAEKIWLPVNGVQQGMILRGGDRTRPLLLFLNGGPGIPDYFLARDAGPEQLFTVCYWDYRGTGLSYSPEIRPEDCTTEQSVQDALAVTDALRTRFGQDRIYLMGHSYGTFIGLLCAQAAPEKYHAYIAMSQIADQPRSELTALRTMEQAAQRQGDRRTAERLAQYDTETADAAWLRRWFSEPERDRAMHARAGRRNDGADALRDHRHLLSPPCAARIIRRRSASTSGVGRRSFKTRPRHMTGWNFPRRTRSPLWSCRSTFSPEKMI